MAELEIGLGAYISEKSGIPVTTTVGITTHGSRDRLVVYTDVARDDIIV